MLGSKSQNIWNEKDGMKTAVVYVRELLVV